MIKEYEHNKSGICEKFMSKQLSANILLGGMAVNRRIRYRTHAQMPFYTRDCNYCMQKITIAILVVIALSFITAGYFYQQMPAEVATHWNAEGQADGFGDKFWGMFLFPFILVAIMLLYLAIPRIDPLRENIKKFMNYYGGFMLLIALFLFYLQMLAIAWNLGSRFNMSQLLAPAFGAFFYYAGILIENAKRNWFIGIRTPWTLSDERVWQKTHARAGWLFKVAGVFALLGVLMPDNAVLLMLIPVILVAFYSILYSYLEYQKIGKKGKRQIR